MGLTNDERSSLVELRLEKAKRFIAEAEQMLSMGLWDLAANRFYYSCFHAAQALLIHYGLSAHTHAGTLGVFGMNFVKTGKNPCLFLSSFRLRLRHHFRHFFRQFISSDMMIFQIDMVQRKGERLQRFLPYRRLQFTFPYHDGMPSHFSQPVQHLMVPLPVSPDFIHPEPGVRFRNHVILASLMSMPKAAIHQNAGTILPQHNIRFSRQPRMIEPIPESPTPQKFPDKNLRFSIPAPYCRHIIMALFYGQMVRHL